MRIKINYDGGSMEVLHNFDQFLLLLDNYGFSAALDATIWMAKMYYSPSISSCSKDEIRKNIEKHFLMYHIVL